MSQDKVGLKVDNTDLDTLIENVDKGKYRIPQFQREYVWSRREVIDLLDSIYHHYPIGSFFLWLAPEKKWNFFRKIKDLDQPSKDEMDRPELSFVLDGQQRLTSLYVVMKGLEFQGTDYNRITFDLDKKKFKISDAKSEHLVKVSNIWNDENLMELTRNLPEDRYKSFRECKKRFDKYDISIIKINSKNINEVIQVFERINQKGTRLSRFDIVNANIWSENFDLRQKIDNEVLDESESKGFGQLDRGTVTQALALTIKGNCTTSTQRILKTDEVKEVWEQTRESLLDSLNYLRGNLGVKKSSFIPYEGMIPLLTYYMYRSGNHSVDSFHQKYIDKWFWRTAVSGRYSSSTQTTMTEDKKLFDKIINGRDVEIGFPLNINKEKLKDTNIKRSTSGLRNALLCILAKNQPKHFENGGEINLSKNYFSNFRIDHHHIFPNSMLKEKGFVSSKRKSVMDITFIPQRLNRHTIRDSTPQEYFTELKNSIGKDKFEKRLDSHLIPYGKDSGIWDNNYNKFLNKRAELFLEEIQNLTGKTEKD